MPTHTHLRNVTDFGQALLSEQLESNISSFLDWSLLEVGGFTNHTLPVSGAYGNYSRLRKVSDTRFSGVAYEGWKANWVHETGIEYGRQPIRVSGVYVNNVFQPSTGVAYHHKIDYLNGRVIFDSPPGNVTVNCEYSTRSVHVKTASSISNFRRDLQFNAFNISDDHYLQFGSGEYNIPSEQRIPLPAVIVEAEPFTSRTPYELGNLIQYFKQAVTLHVFAEQDTDYKKLHDILVSQEEHTIFLYDKNKVARSGVAPLRADGTINPSGKQYPSLVKPNAEGGYGWKEMIFDEVNSRGGAFFESPLYYVPIRAQCVTIL